MPKTNEFIKRKETKEGEFTCHISKENNIYLTFLCKHKNINKTKYVNQILREKLDEIFASMFEKVDI